MEIWKDVVGYEGFYEVSDLGRIKSVPRSKTTGFGTFTTKEKILKFGFTRGYKTVCLVKGKSQRTLSVHRLVAIAFLPPVPGKEHVNHIDANRENNQVDNLEWCTPKENVDHAVRMGLHCAPKGEDCVHAKLTEAQVKEIRARYQRYSRLDGGLALASEFNVSGVTIHNIVNGLSWT